MPKTSAALLTLLLVAAAPAGALPAEEGQFLRIRAPLDEPRGYCLDIRGHKSGVQLRQPLQVHTCKYGIWHLDGLFVMSAAQGGRLRMPHFRLCVEARRMAAGARVGLERCSAGAAQKWAFQADGTIHPAGAATLCLTVAPGAGRDAGPSGYVVRAVSLTACSTAAAARQRWAFVDDR